MWKPKVRCSSPVLSVEDDTIDAMIVKRALRDLQADNPVAHSVNGQDALDYLRDDGNEKPGGILLDLNMPKDEPAGVKAQHCRLKPIASIPKRQTDRSYRSRQWLP